MAHYETPTAGEPSLEQVGGKETGIIDMQSWARARFDYRKSEDSRCCKCGGLYAKCIEREICLTLEGNFRQ